MATNLQLITSSTRSNPHTSTHVIGHLTTLKTLTKQTLAPYLPDHAAGLWAHMLDQLSPGDRADTTSTWLAGSPHCQLVITALPEACSRHNSPIHPHAITQACQDASFHDDNFDLLLVLDQPHDALAASCAVARAFPHFSRKTKSPKASKTCQLRLLTDGQQLTQLEGLKDALQSIQLAASLVDTPPNELHTDAFVKVVTQVAEETGSQCTLIRGEELRDKGIGGLWSVGSAAAHPPALMILTHEPDAPKQTLVWVGKGITYDTGGLSIKGKTGMPGMKRDMAGAAAVLAAFAAAAKANAPMRIHAVLCIAENAVGPLSTRPDDIITMYSGRTVEVNNTDAEGRLVLGDGVAYAAKHLKPDVIIDMATLTGAQMVSTGQRHAAIMANDEALEQQAVQAGRASGDLTHPIPYCPEFFRSEFKSAVADLKNSVKDRANAQSSCAGQFIAEHLGEYKGPWLHIDIAGPSTSGERATGYGVALLLALAGFSPKASGPWGV